MCIITYTFITAYRTSCDKYERELRNVEKQDNAYSITWKKYAESYKMKVDSKF